MRWKSSDSSLTLNMFDMEIMAQCHMSFDEIMQRKRTNPDIPPLWSVLSYVMLQCQIPPKWMWSFHRQLLQMAENTAAHYRRTQIPKSNGGTRILHVPDFEIQAQQQFITDTVLCHLPVDDHAYAYRKGVSIKDCAGPHVHKDILIHLDLKNFFGSITEDMVYAAFLAQTGYSKSLCRLLAQLCCLRGHLPQGTVTSPMLSNVVFRPCDAALAEIANSHQMDYSRYSDDLFFSGNADTDVTALIAEVTDALARFGFQINREKTQVRRPQHRQAVLGLTVNEGLRVNRTYRRKLLQELYYLERFEKNCTGALEAEDYLRYMQQLQGKVAYVLHIDPNNQEFLTAHAKLTRRISQHCFLLEHGFLS